jgi:molybdopterin molybdotransferase
MITYKTAQQKIIKHARLLKAVEQPIENSLGFVLASNARSPIDSPSFDNSAMDGFVFKAKDTVGASALAPVSLKICGSIRAGSTRIKLLKPGYAFKIMTGAPIPKGADTVLEKENARVQNGSLWVTNPNREGRHIRCRGEEIVKKEAIKLKGFLVTPGVIGFLSGLGVTRVRVYQKPRVSLIATGDEIIRSGKKLRNGQIYDSNTPLLTAALKALAIEPKYSGRISDNKETLKAALSKAMRSSDAVILTGGVSVGDYDHVKGVFKDLGVKTVFWKVLQKPGKPIFFGKKGRTLIFGLPGNPAAVHACFYQYVYPALRLLMGHANVWMRSESMVLKHEIRPDQEKTLFLKAMVDRSQKWPRCEALGHQGSHMLSSLCRSHGFIVVPPRNKVLKKNQRVHFQYLPGEPTR